VLVTEINPTVGQAGGVYKNDIVADSDGQGQPRRFYFRQAERHQVASNIPNVCVSCQWKLDTQLSITVVPSWKAFEDRGLSPNSLTTQTSGSMAYSRERLTLTLP
jgi:hypothetical protein